MGRIKELEERIIVLTNFIKVLGKKNTNLLEQAERYGKLARVYRTRTKRALKQLEKGRVEDAIDTLKGEYSEYNRKSVATYKFRKSNEVL